MTAVSFNLQPLKLHFAKCVFDKHWSGNDVRVFKSIRTKMMQDNVLRWGVIGCGSVTEVKSVPAYQQTDGFEVYAVMRRNHELALDYAKRHNVSHVHKSAEALISDPNIDAVYIATPPDTHLEYALAVANVGKICCIEKPLSPSFEESQQIYDAFEKRKIPLFVAYYRRSLPLFNAIKEVVDSGKIGKVRHVAWHYCRPASELDRSKEYNWRTDKNIATGGYFDDLASHGLDIFAYLFGDYSDAKGIGCNQLGLYSSYDSVSATWQHKSGVTGTGVWNFGSYTRVDEVIVYGSEGEIRFSIFRDQDAQVVTPTDVFELQHPYPKHIQKFHVENMQSALLDNKSHPSTGLTALHTSWVMDKILNKIA
ncbi:Gfo/Idh/MocA family protein [Pseudoalteromonas xiamenensis]